MTLQLIEWTSTPVLVLGGAALFGAAMAWQIYRRRRIGAVFEILARELGGRVEMGSVIYYPKLLFSHDGTPFQLYMLSGGGKTGQPGKILFCSFPCPAWSGRDFRLESRSVATEIRKHAGAHTLDTGNVDFDRQFWLHAMGTPPLQTLADGELQHRFLEFRCASGVHLEKGQCSVFVFDGVSDGTLTRKLLELSTGLYDHLKSELGAPGKNESFVA